MRFGRTAVVPATTLALALTTGTPLLAAEDESPQSAEKPAAEASTVLLVNGEEITPELFALYRNTKRSAKGGEVDNKRLQSAVLNELVNMMVLAQDAKSKGLEKLPMVQAQIEFTRLSVLANQAVTDYVKNHEITEADLKKAYEEGYKDKKSQEFKVSHILSATEDEARQVIDELKAGKDFSALAESRSSDTSASNGGKLGWLSPGQIDSAIDEALKSMQAGDFSAQPVKTPFGWHVLLVEEIRDLPAPTYAEMRDSLKQQLQQQELAKYIKTLRENAQLETKNLAEE